MEKEFSLVEDFGLKLLADFYKQINRQGPGSEEVTRTALGFVGPLADDAKIADIGCGTGTQTLTLAEQTSCPIVAVDFMPEFIEVLNARIRQRGLEHRMSTLLESMATLPFAENEFDLIWAEGSIYNIGFETGLKAWRRYLKQGGYIAVSEVSWLTAHRPQKIERFWAENYPEIDTIAHKIEQMNNAGFVPTAHFVLPEECWTDHFFNQMPEAIDRLLEQYAHSEKARQFIESQKAEHELYMEYKDYYSYVFYIGQRTEGEKHSG